MENADASKTLASSTQVGVIAIAGEPAIVINGLPDPSPQFLKDSAVRYLETEIDDEHRGGSGYGELMIGRKVSKKFGKRCYTGKVTKFDFETKWYTMMYEDGDSEELEWGELQEVLLPVDINSPLSKWLLKFAELKRKEQKK